MRIFTLLLALLLLPARAFAEERWYILTVADVPVGWVSENTDGLRTEVAMSARLTRLGKSLDMRFDTVILEEPGGALSSLEYASQLSKQTIRTVVRVAGEELRVTSGTHERVIPRGDQPVIGPREVARLTGERLRVAGDTIAFSMFSPEMQNVVRVRRRLVAREDRSPCDGATGTRIEEALEGLPTPRTLWLDETGQTIGDTVSGPFGAMATCRATKAAALAASGTLPADLYERTVARSNVRFADPFSIDRIVLKIQSRDGVTALPDFTGDNQRLLAPGVVEIRRPAHRAAGPGTTPSREFVTPNALLESDNAEIVAVARGLTGATAWETARALTDWTAKNVNMDAGIVMAPASELIRDRRATCMGYATLLATLARAAAIPSRVAMGYVYYGGIWGGHAWTEMFIDGQWLPFDAAVYAPGIASAMRLSVGTSSLADGGGSFTAPLTALFGRVEIQTVEYESAGRIVKVAQGARPFTLRDDAYVSDGLNLRIPARGFRIERADSLWPSTLVVAFRKAGTLIELHQRNAFPDRPVPADADASFISRDGGTLWVWTARGPESARLLRELLDRVERAQ